MNILLVEDDPEVALHVAGGLEARGHNVERAADGLDGFVKATGATHDVIIMDRMLPVLDGLTVVKRLRGQNIRTPVLYLTTMDAIEDRVDGLEAGGDDYLVKPFAFEELLARVRALARRPTDDKTKLVVGDLEIDLLARKATRGGKPIELFPQEFKLLEYLMRNAGRLVTRTMLLEKVWDLHFAVNTSVVESHMSRLRSKIGPDGADLIQTVRGAGYMLRAA